MAKKTRTPRLTILQLFGLATTGSLSVYGALAIGQHWLLAIGLIILAFIAITETDRFFRLGLAVLSGTVWLLVTIGQPDSAWRFAWQTLQLAAVVAFVGAPLAFWLGLYAGLARRWGLSVPFVAAQPRPRRAPRSRK